MFYMIFLYLSWGVVISLMVLIESGRLLYVQWFVCVCDAAGISIPLGPYFIQQD